MQLLIGWIITTDSNFKISVSAQYALLNISIKVATNKTRNAIVEEVLFWTIFCSNEEDHPHKSIFRVFGIFIRILLQIQQNKCIFMFYSPRWALMVLYFIEDDLWAIWRVSEG